MTTVRTEDHSFIVGDGDDMPIATADFSTGLAGAMHNCALICTGADRGPVTVTAEALDTAPDLADVDDWDDVAEISLTAPVGRLAVHQLLYLPGETPPDLPVLSPTGPGTYRLRIHTRGRDAHHDQVVDTPTEEYHLVCWPAPPTGALIIRATDRCGYGLRLAALTTPPAPPTPSSPVHDPERESLLQNLRRSQR
jgi:hypothetical protein